jgi:hypothetical protein
LGQKGELVTAGHLFSRDWFILFTDWEGTRSGLYTGATSAELSVGFEGMDEGNFQTITDQLYSNYLDNLKDRGYDLANTEILTGNKAVNKHNLVSGGKADYEYREGYISTTPSNFSYYINDKGRAPLAGKMKGVDAVVVDLEINLPFIIDAESGASKLATSAVGGISKIVVKPSLRIIESSNIVFVDPAFLAVSNSKLKKDLVISGVFEDQKFKATATAQTNTSYDIGHITRVYSTDVNTSKIQVAKCNPEKYMTGVKEGINAYLQAATDQFVALTGK